MTPQLRVRTASIGGAIMVTTVASGAWLVYQLAPAVPPPPLISGLALILLALVVLSGLFRLPVGTSINTSVTTAPLFAAALLLTPAEAGLIAFIGPLAYHLLNRWWPGGHRFPWYKYPFNAAQLSLATGAASHVFHLLGGDPLQQVLPAIPAAAAMYAVNTSLVAVIAAIDAAQNPLRLWWRGTRQNGLVELSLMAFGALAATVAVLGSTSQVIFLAVPVGVLYVAFSRLAGTARGLQQERSALTAILPAGVYTTDGEGEITSFNRHAAELWGLGRPEVDPDLRYCGPLKLYTRDGRRVPRSESPVGKVLRDGLAIQSEELVIERSDGSRRRVVMNSAPFQVDQRGTIGAVTCFVDVTPLDKVEHALQLSKEIIDNASDGIVVCDLAGHCLDDNDAFRRLTGYSHEELTNRSLEEVFPSGAFAAVRRDISVAGHARRDLTCRHKNGTTTNVEVVAFLIPGDLQSPARLAVILRDISEQSRAHQRMVEQERDLAVLQERNRLAGEIHDTLAQTFVAISLHLTAVNGSTGEASPELVRSVERARQLAKNGLETARAMVWNLVPLELEGRSLDQALRDELDRLSALGGWTATLKITGRRRELAHPTKVALLRVCQEALVNINKHAHAKAVTVHFTYGVKSLRLTVKDDGVGFDVSTTRAGTRRAGFGITGMEERVRGIGGRLSLRSDQGSGTVLRVSVPWPAQAGEHPSTGPQDGQRENTARPPDVNGEPLANRARMSNAEDKRPLVPVA